MNILITGASGSIGQQLQRRLHSNLYCPSHAELDLTQYYDVKWYFERYPEIELVVHCAVAPPRRFSERRNDEEYGQKINNDICMATNVLRFAPRVIVVNTGVAEHIKGDVGWSAHVISSLCSNLMNVLELRAFGVYGPGEDKDRFPSYCFRQILNDEPIIIHQNRFMSYIYIGDLCDIIAHFATTATKYKQLNVADPFPITMVDVATECIQVANKEVEIKVEGNGEDYIAGSIWKLLDEMPNWTPVSLKEGLKNLYETTYIL